MSEITKTKDQRPKTKSLRWLLFALVIIFIYFYGLTIPLLGPDEPRYSQVAREMYERGDWVTPTLGGADWFEKPALLYWLQIVSYNIFGVSEFAARFGSAVFGLGTILSLWILGKKVQSPKFKVQGFSEIQNPKSKIQNPVTEFANWLAVISASSIGLLAFSRGASFDIILTFPITASLVCYFLFEMLLQKHYFSEDSNYILIPLSKFKIIAQISPLAFAYLFLAGFYFFIGLAILAKGLVGIVFPIAIVFFYHILKKEFLPSAKFLVSLLWGILLSLLVASVWYLPMYQANGWKFIDEFFIQHHFQRYASNKYQHPQPFWFFWIVLPLMTIPWMPFFLAAIWDFVKKIFQRRDVEPQRKTLITHHSSLITFAFAWLTVPLVFFSFSGSKLPGYILPALPAALILTAEYVDRFVGISVKRKYALQIIAFLTFAVVAVLLHYVVPQFAYRDSVKGLIEAARARGYANEKVLNLHTISHNSEFYAAGRLIRAQDGKLRKFLGVGEIVEEIAREDGKPVLALVPLEYLKELTENSLVEAEVLADNTELAIVLVKVITERHKICFNENQSNFSSGRPEYL